MSKPKVFSYFLFMQDQRKLVPGWANKSNNELQALCDPLWRKLGKTEKEKYKKMKKAHKEKVRLEDEQRFASVMRVDIKTKVLVGQVDRPDIVWVVAKVREMEEVQKQLAKAVMVGLPIEEVKVGTAAACKFSVDGEVYRCQVVAMEEEDLVLVRYIDFGNMEKVKKSELCHLPSSLCKMGPVAVRVRVGGMEGVKDNEKNRARVEKRFGVEELEVSLNREGFATFYDNGKLITFKGSKSRVDSEKVIELEVEKNLRLEDMNEAPVQRTCVTDVELGCLEEPSVNELKSVEKGVIQKHEVNLEKEENLFLGETVTNRLDKVAVGDDSEVKESEKFVDCSNNSIKIIIAEVESRGASVPDHVNNSEPTESSTDNTNASLDDKASMDKSSGFTDDVSVDGASVSCETVAVGKEYVKKSDTAFSEASSGIGTDEALADDDNDDIKVVKTDGNDDNLRAVDILADITDISGQHCEIPIDKPTEEDMSPKGKAECKNNIDGSCVGQKTGVSSSSSGRPKLRPPVTKKKKTDVKPKNSSCGWQVGDKVVAQWVEDGVWRQGTVHEIVGDMAYVVCKEQLVRAARVRLDKLRHSTMPVEVLNMLEEELVRDCEEEESLGESTTNVSSSIQEVYEEVEQEQFSDELEDLLALLPSVDIDMLTSPSCSDLLESLVIMIPSLPLSQVDMLMDGMMKQDLLIPAALHPSAYLLATQLVKYVMVANSNMKGQVMNCLARQADEMQRNIWGREVLRTLHGYI